MGKNRLPYWFRQPLPDDKVFNTLNILKTLKVNTVCKMSHCPNLTGCFKNGELTFMILGRVCTRDCKFCAIDKANSTDLVLDKDEPENIKEATKLLGLKYVVLTSVTRDDLPDAGAGQFKRTIEAIGQISNSIKIEVLIPDFFGSLVALKEVVDVHPEVIAHNLETVPGLYPEVRPSASYRRSLNILKVTKKINSNIITKSSLILGLGEREEEVINTLEDLVSAGIDILTLGQYLAPSGEHYPVKKFISLEQFDRYKDIALNSGIKAVLSHPLARSSYQAEKLYQEAQRCSILS